MHGGQYNASKKTSLSEVGVISALSKPITAAKIPILYLSTFNSAFIFVQAKHCAVAKLVLENSGFKVGTLEERLALNEDQSLPSLPPTEITETSETTVTIKAVKSASTGSTPSTSPASM